MRSWAASPVLCEYLFPPGPGLAALRWGHFLWAHCLLMYNRGGGFGAPYGSHEIPRKMAIVATLGGLCPRGRQSRDLVGWPA